ncbi:MAG: NAD(P)/FAD-dependent oxidoreductase, partial [Myxococcales bacterium]
MTNRYDAIIVGGGHNGLACAAYLAKAGRKTLVLERRHVLGGAAVTEEIFPGFKYTVCSYVVSLLRPEVIRELELARHGLHITPLDSAFVPMENGDHFATYSDPESMRQEIRRHSVRDAEMAPKFSQLMYEMAFAVKPILGVVPPDPSRPGLRGLRTLRDLGRHVRDLGPRTFHDLTKLMTMSASDLLDEWFETDVIKALFALNGIIGTMLGPKSPGTAYVLLHHYMGELDGAFTAWGCQ